MAPLFPNPTDFRTLRWLIGNSLLDPVQEHKVIILCGRGGSGKSTVTRIVEMLMTGCVKPISGAIFADIRITSLPERTIPGIVGSRIMIGGDVNFANGVMNTQVMKSITGNDILRHPTHDILCIRASASVMLCTNVLPDENRTPEYHTPAIMRRLVMLPMRTNARNLVSRPEPTDSVQLATFMHKCVAECVACRDMPVSPCVVLTTIFPSRISLLESIVEFSEDATYLECSFATMAVCRHTDTPRTELVSIASEISPAAVWSVGSAFKSVLRGIRLSPRIPEEE